MFISEKLRMFWSKGHAKAIKEEILSLEKTIVRLPSVAEQRDKLALSCKQIVKLSEYALHDISRRTQEVISYPWIDSKYDKELQKAAEDEISLLHTIHNAADEILFAIEDVTQKEHALYLVEQITHFGPIIKSREERFEQLVEEFTNATLRSRHSNFSIPPLATNDRVAWKKIAIVAVSLGASVVNTAGRHPCEIRFPHASRPIPLSKDVSSQVLAKEIKSQLSSELPEYKIPTVGKIHDALKAGDIRKAA